MSLHERARCPKCLGSGWMADGVPSEFFGLSKHASVPCDACEEAAPACGPCRGTGRVGSLDLSSEERTAPCPRCEGLGVAILPDSGTVAHLEAVRAARRAGEASLGG